MYGNMKSLLIAIGLLACLDPLSRGQDWEPPDRFFQALPYWADQIDVRHLMGFLVPAPVAKTGQTSSFSIGDDGDLQMGIAWASPRFSDHGDGTVTDNNTGLIWLKNADCFGNRLWADALNDCNNLADGSCGLSDGSTAGDWRLPSVNELLSLLDYGYSTSPALSNAAGTGQWTEGDAFTGVNQIYWSSTTVSQPYISEYAWVVDLWGYVDNNGKGSGGRCVWPVRGGQAELLDLIGILAPAPVRETGQKTSYAIGDDGDLRPGVAWPNPRFTANGDGTVTDNLTGLIWLENASCGGALRWQEALDFCNSLADGSCGLSDGSIAGDWHLPSINELYSLIDCQYNDPALSNAAGTDQWTEGDAFSGVDSIISCWSSTTLGRYTDTAFHVYLRYGEVYHTRKSSGLLTAWPVRSGL